MIPPRKIISCNEPYSAPTEGRKGKLRLDFNENTLGCSPKVIESLRKITAGEISSYPAYGDFKSNLADYLEVTPAGILLTNGSDEAIKAIMDAYVNSGDEVIIPAPTFSLFRAYASIAGARIVEIDYNSDLSFPLEQILTAIRDATKIIIIVNPNNPTGTCIDEECIIRILDAAKNSLVVIDEAYWQFAGKSCKSLIAKYDNLVVLQTFSKAFGLAGLRIGYALSNTETISTLRKAVSPYNVSSLAISSANAAISDTDFVNEYVAEVSKSKAYLEDELRKLGITTYPSVANFILARLGEKSEMAYDGLKQKGILVRSMKKYPQLNGCIRITAGTVEQSEFFIKELKQILRKKAVLFDMDGVLVDVSESYRLAIRNTAEFFTGQDISPDEIQKLKNKGGYNNDWDITAALIASKGYKASKNEIIRKFQQLYLGKNKKKGLNSNERWIAPPEILSALYREYSLGIVTGRPRDEALLALNRFGMPDFFECIVTMEDCPKERAKPDPFGIKLAMKKLGCEQAAYIGDNIDDMKAARAAGIQAIGIIPDGTFGGELKKAFLMNGAKIVLDDIRQLSGVLK
ncbi:histidinol-phosphate transaminase [Candidatus Woesearchaeota archaeon]|nr:histidinol-phosphate transaminase [Candidatus Woesearchaeota archaeon]